MNGLCSPLPSSATRPGAEAKAISIPALVDTPARPPPRGEPMPREGGCGLGDGAGLAAGATGTGVAGALCVNGLSRQASRMIMVVLARPARRFITEFKRIDWLASSSAAPAAADTGTSMLRPSSTAAWPA